MSSAVWKTSRLQKRKLPKSNFRKRNISSALVVVNGNTDTNWSMKTVTSEKNTSTGTITVMVTNISKSTGMNNARMIKDKSANIEEEDQRENQVQAPVLSPKKENARGEKIKTASI